MNDITYIIRESSEPTLVGKKLVLEFDAGTYWFEKYILTIFKDRKDVPILYDAFSYTRLSSFLKDNQIKLVVDRKFRTRYYRCLQDHPGMSTVFNIASGLYIFAISFNRGESVQQSISEKRVNKLNKMEPK